MVVKTYPTPSARYGELVCTAGIDIATGEWIRIYPFPFRQSDRENQFQKYDIIEMAIEPAFPTDPRPDSWKLYDINSVVKVDQIQTGNEYWTPRMKHIRPTIVKSVQDLKNGMLSEDKQTWGKSILPVPVKSGSAKFSYQHRGPEADWSDSDKTKLEQIMPSEQGSLFASLEGKQYLNLLEKIPYTFRLTFEDLTGSIYTYPILDWEIGSLYHRYNNEEEALEKVRYKLEEQIFSTRNEVFLVLGNIHHRYKKVNSLAIDGFIYPKLQQQPSLFGDEGV